MVQKKKIRVAGALIAGDRVASARITSARVASAGVASARVDSTWDASVLLSFVLFSVNNRLWND